MAKAYQRLGVIYKALSEFDSAMEYFFKARDISYSKKDTLTGAVGDMTIAQVYWYLKQYKKGMKHIDKAINIGKKAKLIDNVVSPSYIEKGNIYMLLGKLDSSLVYYKMAEKTIVKTPQKEGLVGIYSNIGGISFYKGNFKEAIKYYNKAKKLAKEFNDITNLGLTKINLGEVYYTVNQFEKSERELKESLSIAKKINNKLNIVYSYDYLHNLEVKRNQPKKALEYFKLKTIYKDSILNEKNLNKISSLEVKYKTAEKEKQLAEQNLEIQTKEATIALQRNTQLMLIGGLGFLILGSLLFYNRNKAKQKETLQKAVLKEKEKGFASVIKASEDERKRISKDLHDGIGQEMAVLKMGINYLKETEKDASKKEEIDKLLISFSKSADEIRNISHQMMPRLLMEKGLVDAIVYLLQVTFRYSKMKYEFEHFEVNQRFDERIEISLYRVLQELVTNVIKHANATTLNVLLHKQNDKLILFVEDNGIGMQNKSKKGHGVLNIKSRIDMVNGSVNYQPSESSGTTATITIPL